MATILSKSEYLTLKQRLKRKYRRMFEEELDNYTCKELLRSEAKLDPIEDGLPVPQEEEQEDISNLSDDDLYDIVCCKHQKQLQIRKRATRVVKTNYHTGKPFAYKSHKTWLWSTYSSRAYVEYKKYCTEANIPKKTWVDFLKILTPHWKLLSDEEAEEKLKSEDVLLDWNDILASSSDKQ